LEELLPEAVAAELDEVEERHERGSARLFTSAVQ
jgi:hypothetical protein